jgi:diguanylate cyclase (GGDEF)-like protein
LRGVQWAAIVPAGLGLLLLALRMAGLLQAELAWGARLFGAAVSVVLLAAVLITTRMLERTLGLAQAAAEQQQRAQAAKERALENARQEAELARARLAGAIEALPATFELYDADDRLVMWNRALAEAYPHMAPFLDRRLTFEQLARLNVTAGGQPEYAGRPDEWVALRQAQRRDGNHLPQMLDNGRGRWLRVYETRLADGSMVAIRADVTDAELQRRALDETRQELLRSRQRLEDAIEAMPAGFELYDADDRLVMVNGMNQQMYPLLADLAASHPTFEEVVRANAARGGLPLLQSAAALDAWIAQRKAERKAPGDVRVHRIGEDRWVRVHERRTREGGVVAVRLDVSELMRREAELSALNAQLAGLNTELSVLSQTDALTGLANRRAFDLRLAEEVSRAVRHNMRLALLLVDVDHFKRYNDRHGHPAGDECLRRVAAVLREHGRRPTDLVARIGGEEFALLLPHQDVAGALALAETCVQAVDTARITHLASTLGFVTVSAGVAVLHDGIADASSLLRAADAALYRAKESGRHRAMLADAAPH